MESRSTIVFAALALAGVGSGCAAESADAEIAELRAELDAAGPAGIVTTYSPCLLSDELVFVEDVWSEPDAQGDIDWLGMHIVAGPLTRIDTTSWSGVSFRFVNCADHDIDLLEEIVVADVPTYVGTTEYPVTLRGQSALVTSSETGETHTRRELGDYDVWDFGIQFEGRHGETATYIARTDDPDRPELRVELAPGGS